MSEREARKLWRKAAAVCFDFDSTVVRTEGINELARFCGAGEQVALMTLKAMGGTVTFRESLKTSLDVIRPTLQQVETFRQLHTPDGILTPGIERLVQLLHSRGTAVHIVSGGFRRLIQPFAEHLSIPTENIHANTLLFNSEGQYAGFDESELTSNSGGKALVVGQIKQNCDIVAMVGDGATDLEASPPADTFIGFGGNVVREKVKEGAPWFIYDMQDLITELGE